MPKEFVLKRKFNPQITQINADFQKVVDEYRNTSNESSIQSALCLIGGNLRNLRTIAFPVIRGAVCL